MWEINPVLCTNVTVRGVKISSHGPNNDGCDPDSSKDVLIENCSFDIYYDLLFSRFRLCNYLLMPGFKSNFAGIAFSDEVLYQTISNEANS